jgi:hypothetical protein
MKTFKNFLAVFTTFLVLNTTFAATAVAFNFIPQPTPSSLEFENGDLRGIQRYELGEKIDFTLYGKLGDTENPYHLPDGSSWLIEYSTTGNPCEVFCQNLASTANGGIVKENEVGAYSVVVPENDLGSSKIFLYKSNRVVVDELSFKIDSDFGLALDSELYRNGDEILISTLDDKGERLVEIPAQVDIKIFNKGPVGEPENLNADGNNEFDFGEEIASLFDGSIQETALDNLYSYTLPADIVANGQTNEFFAVLTIRGGDVISAEQFEVEGDPIEEPPAQRLEPDRVVVFNPDNLLAGDTLEIGAQINGQSVGLPQGWDIKVYYNNLNGGGLHLAGTLLNGEVEETLALGNYEMRLNQDLEDALYSYSIRMHDENDVLIDKTSVFVQGFPEGDAGGGGIIEAGVDAPVKLVAVENGIDNGEAQTFRLYDQNDNLVDLPAGWNLIVWAAEGKLISFTEGQIEKVEEGTYKGTINYDIPDNALSAVALVALYDSEERVVASDEFKVDRNENLPEAPEVDGNVDVEAGVNAEANVEAGGGNGGGGGGPQGSSAPGSDNNNDDEENLGPQLGFVNFFLNRNDNRKCTDVASDYWAKDILEEMVGNEQFPVEIEDDEVFCRPKRKVTRKEFTAWLLSVYRPELVENIEDFDYDWEDSPLEDIIGVDPYDKYIIIAFNEGIINGYPDGYFRPNRVINRAEVLKILSLSSGIFNDTDEDIEKLRSNSVFTPRIVFADINSDHHYYYNFLHFASAMAYSQEFETFLIEGRKVTVNGRSETHAAMDQPILFSEAAKIVLLAQKVKGITDL